MRTFWQHRHVDVRAPPALRVGRVQPALRQPHAAPRAAIRVAELESARARELRGQRREQQGAIILRRQLDRLLPLLLRHCDVAAHLGGGSAAAAAVVAAAAARGCRDGRSRRSSRCRGCGWTVQLLSRPAIIRRGVVQARDFQLNAVCGLASPPPGERVIVDADAKVTLLRRECANYLL